jgi:hypothetical protein
LVHKASRAFKAQSVLLVLLVQTAPMALTRLFQVHKAQPVLKVSKAQSA